MAYPTTNLGAVNTNKLTDENKLFGNFDLPNYSVSQDVNDAIIGFFEKTTGNKQSALALASAVIYTSLNLQADPMAIVREFAKLDPQSLNDQLTAFLNLNRKGSSYLGVKNYPQTGKYVKRAIRA